MSYSEYTDMFWDAQAKNADESQYRMLAIDIVNSRCIFGGYDPEVLDAFAMEVSRLLAEDRVLMPFRYQSVANKAWVTTDSNLTFVVKGDFRGIIMSELILRDVLGIDRMLPACDIEEEVDAYLWDILAQAAELAAIDFDVHWESAVFETWEWAEGADKYALAYCAPQLEEISKDNGKMMWRIS